MPIIKTSRRSSLKALQYIRQIATGVDSDEQDSGDDRVGRKTDSSEHASEYSGSNFEANTSGSSSSESESIDSASSEEMVTPESDSAEDVMGPLSKKLSQQSLKLDIQKLPTGFTLSSSYAHKGRRCPALSQFISYVSTSKQRQLKGVRQMAVDCFAGSIVGVQNRFLNLSHPFCAYPDVSFKDESNARRSALYPTTFFWTPCPTEDIPNYLPGPYFSPLIAGSKGGPNERPTKTKRFNRFQFSEGNNLLYVGGYVKAIAWCPPRMYSPELGADDLVNEPIFFAVATYPSPGTRIQFSDPAQSAPGVIQIWTCGNLGLMSHPIYWQPEPHLFVSHSWGHVMDMCWVPISPIVAARIPRPAADHCLNRQVLTRITPTPLVNRIIGHLVVACQDGFVRIFAPPQFQLDPVFFHTFRPCPLYQLSPAGILTLSPCVDKHPNWLGWPNVVHIRPEYPDRLFVGYSRGHVAHYDLQCLDPDYFNAQKIHLSPIRLFRLLNGPVQSMSLNPRNGRMLAVQGIDVVYRVWDIEDTCSLNTADSSEFSWPLIHGTPGRQVVWHSRGDIIYNSRESYHPTSMVNGERKGCSRELSDTILRNENCVVGTWLEAPNDGGRYLAPLGIQSVSHMNFSEPLNTLICATDRGRVELLVDTLDGRAKVIPKVRYLDHVRIPLLQWSLSPIPQPAGEISETEEQLFERLLQNKCYLIPSSAASVNPSTVENFLDPSCPDCTSAKSFCWHKLWTQYELTLSVKTKIVKTPYADFIKTPLLNVTQVEFCPHSHAATWVAVGTAFGFVQFICIDALYLTDFDALLNLPPSGNKDSVRLKLIRQPESRSVNAPSPWCVADPDPVEPKVYKKRGRPRKYPKPEENGEKDVRPVRATRRTEGGYMKQSPPGPNGQLEDSDKSNHSDATEAMAFVQSTEVDGDNADIVPDSELDGIDISEIRVGFDGLLGSGTNDIDMDHDCPIGDSIDHVVCDIGAVGDIGVAANNGISDNIGTVAGPICNVDVADDVGDAVDDAVGALGDVDNTIDAYGTHGRYSSIISASDDTKPCNDSPAFY